MIVAIGIVIGLCSYIFTGIVKERRRYANALLDFRNERYLLTSVVPKIEAALERNALAIGAAEKLFNGGNAYDRGIYHNIKDNSKDLNNLRRRVYAQANLKRPELSTGRVFMWAWNDFVKYMSSANVRRVDYERVEELEKALAKGS